MDETTMNVVDESYMEEWRLVCERFCERVGARLVFVNSDNLGAEFPDGTMRHMYAGEMASMLATLNGVAEPQF